MEQTYTHLHLLNLTDYYVISFGAKQFLRLTEENPLVYKLNYGRNKVKCQLDATM